MHRLATGLLVVALVAPARADDGYVELPLPLWVQLRSRAGRAAPEPAPPAEVVYLERRLEGAIHRGLLSATLVTRFQVLAAGHVRVPVLDAAALPARVRLGGKPTSLLADDGMYTAGVDRPGVYEIEIAFHHGQEQDRFSRRLEMALPAGGVTRVSLLVPEPDIEARLEHGALTASATAGGGTRLEGWLDAGGKLDLSWSRRTAVGRPAAAALRARARALLTVEEAVVEGLVAFDLEGETDRLELRVPAEVEIGDVTGDAVLKWRADGGVLTVLLGAGRAAVTVRFQYPVDAAGRVALRLPLPTLPVDGVLGVRAPAGLEVRVASAAAARPLAPRDLPAELAAMSATPIRFGFAFAAAPEITLLVARLAQVELLLSTLIDDLEALTVLLDDGSEADKLRLHIRNNTRQYLAVRLPAGAVLTHALLDGRPVRPARGDGDTLLFSLRQSERIDPGVGRVHVVRRGDTLRDIAHLYYSDPGKWSPILEANRKLLTDETDLQAGQRLVIPSAGPLVVEESSFVLELAYRRSGPALGRFGAADLRLPELDVPALGATWHVYLPSSIVPLAIDANLTQQSQLRYTALRRLQLFLDEAFGGRKAWAGDYRSILEKRKDIFRDEAVEKGGADVAPALFPLVGERHRFKRILLGREQPRVAFVYIDRGAAAAARWAAFALAFALALALLRSPRRPWRWAAAAAAGIALLVAGHFVLGVYRRVVWGVDLALLVEVVRLRPPRATLRLRAWLWSPWRLVERCTLRTLALAAALVAGAEVAVRYPLLLSLLALVVLVRLWQRSGVLRAAAAILALLAFPGGARAADVDDAAFDAVMAPAPEPEAAPDEEPPDAADATVRVALPELERLWPAPHAAAPGGRAPAVVLGAARYEGRAEGAALALRAQLSVTLGGPGAWKTVPLVGDDVVLARAAVGGRPIGVTAAHGYQVWVTRQGGEVTIDLDILVPARGASEYSFRVVRTPVTELVCRFPGVGLEPQLDGAVQANVGARGGETVLEAALLPATRLRLVSFHDLGDAREAPARVVAETLSLVSVDETTVDVFSLVRYRILAGRAREFAVELPAGARVVAADGRGGFRWQVEGGVLRGETAFPIRDRYEISLRLARDLDAGAAAGFTAPVPRARGVERELGWLAVEAPGKARIEEAARVGPSAVDTRQLPPELVQSAVGPILRAYRYPDAAARAVVLRAVRLPEQPVAAEGIDRVRAFTVVSAEGTTLTEMRLTLKNRLRQSLALALRDGAVVRSTLLDGRPVAPGRDATGALLLPLDRSRRAGGGLEPITVHVVFEDCVAPLDAAGRRELRLPAVDLPVSSLAWSVFLPEGSEYSALSGGAGAQRYAGRGQWIAPEGDAEEDPGGGEPAAAVATGAMPVRIELPKAGVRLEHERWWLAAREPASVSIRFVRRQLLYPLALLLGVLAVAAARLAARARHRAWRVTGAGLAVAAAGSLGQLAGARVALVAATAALLVALRPGRLRALGDALAAWARTLPERRRADVDRGGGFTAWRATVAALLVFAALVLAERAVELAIQLGTPLGG